MTLETRPRLRQDTSLQFVQSTYNDERTFRGDYTGTDLIYRGYAVVGADTSVAVWQIAKLAYDGSHNVLSIKWPVNSSGATSSDYGFIWDNRAALTYV